MNNGKRDAKSKGVKARKRNPVKGKASDSALPIKSLKAKLPAAGNAVGQGPPHKTRVLCKTSILRSENERCG